MTAIVVVHTDETGFTTTYSNGDVTIFWVDDRCLSDRIYRMTPDPIPEGMLDGPVGFAGDKSAAEIKTLKAVKDILGEQPFEVIDGEKS